MKRWIAQGWFVALSGWRLIAYQSATALRVWVSAFDLRVRVSHASAWAELSSCSVQTSIGTSPCCWPKSEPWSNCARVVGAASGPWMISSGSMSGSVSAAQSSTSGLWSLCAGELGMGWLAFAHRHAKKGVSTGRVWPRSSRNGESEVGRGGSVWVGVGGAAIDLRWFAQSLWVGACMC